MPRAFDQVEFGFWPGLVQRPGIGRRAWHVVAAVDNDAGDAVELVRIAQQLPLVQPAGIDEIVVFDAGKGVGIVFLLERRRGRRLRQKRDRFALPDAPGLGGGKTGRAVIAGQPPVIGKHHFMAFVFRDRGQEAFPFVREHLRDAELIVPVQLGLGQRVDTAHDKL